MKKIMFLLVVVISALSISGGFAQVHEGNEIEFVNTIHAELASKVTISVNTDLDTLLYSGEGIYEYAIVEPITLPGISVKNKYTPARGRWVVPAETDIIYVLFEYDGKSFTNEFDVGEGKNTIMLTPDIIGLMMPVKSEFVSDMMLIKNNTGFDIKIKVKETNIEFPLDGVTLSSGGSTYTKLPAESGIRHFVISSLQDGAVINTVKTVFISNTTASISFNAEDVIAKTSETEMVSVKIVNNTGYPITVTLPALVSSVGADNKKTTAQEPIDIFLGPGTKTLKWYDVNLGLMYLTVNVSFKNSDIPYDLQTTIFEKQKLIVIEGGTKKGLRISQTPQRSSAYTY